MKDGKRTELKQALFSLKDSKDQSAKPLLEIIRDIPQKPEFTDLFELAFEQIDGIDDPHARRSTLLDFVKEVPLTSPFRPVYSAVMEALIIAADTLREGQHRVGELIRFAKEIPGTKDLIPLRLHAWRLALNLPDKPRYQKPSLETIAKGLPKTSDYSFYRRYTLLGVTKELPKEVIFLDLYREAIQLAIDAVAVVEEPFYKKYALFFIAGELKKDGRCQDLYMLAVSYAYEATITIREPLTREHALIELLKELPGTQEFAELLMGIIDHALRFFTIKRWMEDIEVLEIVDRILLSEEAGLKESKQRMFYRGKYSDMLSRELERIGVQLKDVRFIEILKPYTHVWIQPKSLRDSVRKVLAGLESLKDLFHGREIEIPLFTGESHPYVSRPLPVKEAVSNDCISIDLGATNTVVMRKKGDALPEFITLPLISKKYDSTVVIPTILGEETDNIGAEVAADDSLYDIKQSLLEGNERGRLLMSRFFRILYGRLNGRRADKGWFSLSPKSLAEVLYITIPVGFHFYRKSLEEIAKKSVRGAKIKFIEEPLAAAIGYQVAETSDRVVMIIDFGGSTFNTLIARVNVNEIHAIARPDRAKLLGGRDIDAWLAAYLAEKTGLSSEGLSPEFLTAAEELKIGLSKKDEIPFKWDNSHSFNVSRRDMEEVLDRHEFYKNIDRTISNVLKMAEKVGVTKDKVEAVLLTGGSSQIPSFKEKIGHIFPKLRGGNLIYDHSPLSAVATGAALSGTRTITGRFLAMAYAIRHVAKDGDSAYSYSIVLQKGEALPIERSYMITPAKRLGVQNEISLELIEVPENLIERRWVKEAEMEFIRQELTSPKELTLNSLKSVTLSFDESLNHAVDITFCVNEDGTLQIRYGKDGAIKETGIRLH